MPITLNGKMLYRTSEVWKIAGISRSTLLRWIADGIIEDASLRDRRGWRLFTESDINQIKDEASHARSVKSN